MFTIHTTGNWARRSLHASIAPSTRLILPEVESAIESAWQEGQRRLGTWLFDGPMCRMESWRASADSLELRVSLTSYRIFLGTNLNADVSAKFAREALANPIGVSSALLTSDGWLLFGRRNASVAYYPNRVHPFAGALEEQDLSDVFRAVERELGEEISLLPNRIESIHCLGLAEDAKIKQPELIFRTRTRLTRSQIEQQVNTEEHGGSVAIEATRDSIQRAISDPQKLTPIAVATLQLFADNDR